MDALHREGKIREWGLSNFPALAVVSIHHACAASGRVRPTVYQGCYNAITRSVEFELMPAARSLGIHCYHYSPLAGG